MYRLEDKITISADDFRYALINKLYHPVDAIQFVRNFRPDLEDILVDSFYFLWDNSRISGMDVRNMRNLLELYRESGINTRIKVKDKLIMLNNFYKSILTELLLH